MELSERKKNILKSIIDAYITSGEPVGSKYLTTLSGFNVSSATIRNEMSELESLGFLEQPHTSAGRIPSAQGYRMYIDGLMERYSLGVEEIRLLNDLLNFKLGEMDSLLKQAGRVLSKVTNYTSFSVVKKMPNVPKRFEAVMIDSCNFLLIIICEDGTTRTQHIRSETVVGADEIRTLMAVFNEKLCGITPEMITLQTVLEIEECMGYSRRLVTPVLKAVYNMLSDERTEDDVNVTGITKLLNYPEFFDVEKARGVLEVFDSKKRLVQTMLEAQPEKTYILISGDGTSVVPTDSSFVFRPVSIDGVTVGAVGIIGPKRMDYKRVIASLEYFSKGLATEIKNSKDSGEG